jgi:hypothetical protein
MTPRLPVNVQYVSFEDKLRRRKIKISRPHRNCFGTLKKIVVDLQEQ